MLAGALDTLGSNDTTLAGGHSSEGAELGLGFSVNGFAKDEALLRKAGMRPGDRLILTKPLGTGTLFAADMRTKAKGRWIEAALASMMVSNRNAAKTLIRHGATAATDVTGFGLAGHLLEMVSASGFEAEFDLDILPVLEGVEATLSAGIVSSLQEANARIESSIRSGESALRHPLFQLLFDPQTAGGLLASVPAEKAGPCVEELHRSGVTDAVIIGKVCHEGSEPPGGSVVRVIV